jgi:hypothetical protein
VLSLLSTAEQNYTFWCLLLFTEMKMTRCKFKSKSEQIKEIPATWRKDFFLTEWVNSLIKGSKSITYTRSEADICCIDDTDCLFCCCCCWASWLSQRYGFWFCPKESRKETFCCPAPPPPPLLFPPNNCLWAVTLYPVETENVCVTWLDIIDNLQMKHLLSHKTLLHLTNMRASTNITAIRTKTS